MDAWIELFLCVVAWSLVLFKFRNILRDRVWKRDPLARTIWLAMLSFAVAMTFLVESIAVPFDTRTLNNLSRLFAYSFVSLTLYFTTALSFYTDKTQHGVRTVRSLKHLLLVNLFALVVLYAFFISRAPEWRDHHVPNALAEAGFMFSMYIFSFTSCCIMVWQNLRYLNREKVAIMRVRVAMLVVTALAAGFYFFLKIILVGGYFWAPLGSEALVTLSKVLLVFSGLMWGIAFVHSKVYLRVVGQMKILSHWRAFRDIEYLLNCLDRLCPPVALTEDRPSSREFLRKSEYHLYRAIIRILDGKTMLADFLSSDRKEQPEWWNSRLIQDAKQVNRVLESVHTSGDFWELVHSFRIASKQLLRYRQYSYQEAVP
jgi:hypothetical protein